MYPRVSGLTKFDPWSLHWILNFEENTEEFLRKVERTSIQGDNIHNAVRARLYSLINNGKINYAPHDLPPLESYDYSTLTSVEKEKTHRCINWILNENLTLLCPPEKTIVSPGLGFGGSPDFVCLKNHDEALIDLKTGDKFHSTNWLQLEAYALLLEYERSIRVKTVGILLVGAEKMKTGVKYSERPLSQKRRDEFLRIVDAWYAMFPEPFLPFTPDKTPSKPEEKELVAA